MSPYPDPPGGPPDPYNRDNRQPGGSQYPPPPGEEDDRQPRYPPPPGEEDDRHPRYPPPPGEEDDRHLRAYHHQRVPSAGSNIQPPYRHPQEHMYPPPPQHNGYPPPDPRLYSPRDQYQPTPYREDRGYPQEYSRGPPQHPGQQQSGFSQSAPRQRTAIACRYCRRRKIRCSGFDQNPEGRCSNCQRFQQECIFTPVSSQAQAFVPAHAVYPHMRGMQVGPDGRTRQTYPGQHQAQIYGAHGQPLGPLPQQPLQHAQHPQHPPQPHSPYNDYPMASPTGSYSSFTDENQTSRKRPAENPHQQILPPPLPGQGQSYPIRENGNRRQPVEMQQQDERHHLAPLTPTSQDSRGPAAPPASNYSPGSSTSSNGGLHPPHSHLPAMSRTPPPRSSPSGDISAAGNRQDPMSLRSIVDRSVDNNNNNRRPDGSGIDKDMLGRLDRKPGPN